MSVGLISLPEDYFDAISSPDAFMKRNWHHCLYWAFTYLCIVHVGPVLMKGFRKWNFRFPLVVWNMLMTVYSCWTLYQVAPEFFRVLSKHGLSASYCNRFGLFEGDLGYWVALFHFSKLIELGDTLFLILRQRPVVYIHYFHHTAVLLFCWYSYRFHTAPARWGVFMNSAVHSVMYLYFLSASMGAKLPRCIKMFITCTQIVQFILGSLICVSVFYRIHNNQPCDTTMFTAVFQLTVYVYLLILFSHYFYHAYLRKEKSS